MRPLLVVFMRQLFTSVQRLFSRRTQTRPRVKVCMSRFSGVGWLLWVRCMQGYAWQALGRTYTFGLAAAVALLAGFDYVVCRNRC